MHTYMYVLVHMCVYIINNKINICPFWKKLENTAKKIVKHNHYPNLSTKNSYNLHFSMVSIFLCIEESTLTFLPIVDF